LKPLTFSAASFRGRTHDSPQSQPACTVSHGRIHAALAGQRAASARCKWGRQCDTSPRHNTGREPSLRPPADSREGPRQPAPSDGSTAPEPSACIPCFWTGRRFLW
jgi:hypothetical protein